MTTGRINQVQRNNARRPEGLGEANFSDCPKHWQDPPKGGLLTLGSCEWRIIGC
jgi:hypothetical protein